ncbi:hypothetical protein [Candidatus Uabimicrobium amorphum]|uniref:Uncharacterized protein n=1 Tax=Uabimicrobium amorphum TaxID=2596890 RepID=A0A5S9IIB2_UABAM|nr:hypothetical protein [Candidatus Uabimicrobium amorphum]BBM82349.1 hypothetical protein UABAM_00692 [Candidatus Uabimicrobium amorphum]
MRYLYFFVVLLSTTFVFSDVIIPNTKRIEHVFNLQGCEKYSNNVFVAYPVNVSRGRPMFEHRVLTKDSFVSSGRFCRTQVLVFKKDAYDNKAFAKMVADNDMDTDKTISSANCEVISLNFSSKQVVRSSDPTQRIVDVYRLQQKKKTQIFEVVHSKKIYVYKNNKHKVIDYEKKDKKSSGDEQASTFEQKEFYYLGIPILALMGVILVVFRRKT